MAARNIKLSSVPDPESIGKSSATLEDLRKRIYTYSSKRQTQDESQQQHQVEFGNVVQELPNNNAPIPEEQGLASAYLTAPATPPRVRIEASFLRVVDDRGFFIGKFSDFGHVAREWINGRIAGSRASFISVGSPPLRIWLGLGRRAKTVGA